MRLRMQLMLVFKSIKSNTKKGRCLMLTHCYLHCPANLQRLMLYNVEDQSRVWFSVVQVVLCGLAQCLLLWDCALLRSGCSLIMPKWRVFLSAPWWRSLLRSRHSFATSNVWLLMFGHELSFWVHLEPIVVHTAGC